MPEFLDTIQPRKTAIQTTKENIENEFVVTNVTTPVTTSVVTFVATKNDIKKTEFAKQLTIRIVDSKKIKIDKLAKKFNTTRQNIINQSLDEFLGKF
jgi:nitrogenase subunit NifH